MTTDDSGSIDRASDSHQTNRTDLDPDPPRSISSHGHVPADADSDVSDVDSDDSIDSLLEFLPDQEPSVTARHIAERAYRDEHRRTKRRAAGLKFAALGFSIVLTVAGWSMGFGRQSGPAAFESAYAGLESFQGLFRISLDDSFVDRLLDTGTPSVWDDVWKSGAADQLGSARFVLRPEDRQALEKTALASYLALPDAERARWRALAQRIETMPLADRAIVRNRLTGMRIVLGSMSEADRKRAESLDGLDRWNLLAQRAATQRRLADQAKRPAFSVSEFNRPDYLMDLALVIRQWNRMSPLEKRTMERRASMAKTDPARKIERLRLLAQTLEAEGADLAAAGKTAAGRIGPLQRALTKADMLKKERERRRSDFQKLVSGSMPEPLAPEELERFQESLPPWLIESVDPMPPDEARRFLSLLSFLVEHKEEMDDESRENR